MTAVKRLDAIDFVNVGDRSLESSRRPASCRAASSIEIGETNSEIIGKKKKRARRYVHAFEQINIIIDKTLKVRRAHRFVFSPR